MNFNELVIERLQPEFLKYGLQLIEYRKNYLMFRSNEIVLTLSHDNMENSNTISLGENGYSQDSLNDKIIKEVLNLDIQLENRAIEDFISNLAVLFDLVGNELLTNRDKILTKIRKFVQKMVEDYNNEVIRKQAICADDKCWSEKDYKGFIREIHTIRLDQLPKSYEMKYKIALKKSAG